MEFHPGFELNPKKFVENESYSIKYSETRINGKWATVSKGSRTYDWSPIMNILLEALENFEDSEIFRRKATSELSGWLKTFPGWGLRAHLLPKEIRSSYLKTLRDLRTDIFRPEFFTEQQCWNFWRMVWLDEDETRRLFPHFYFDVRAENDEDDASRTKLICLTFYEEQIVQSQVRKLEGILSRGDIAAAIKGLRTIRITKKWKMEIKFVVEKKRKRYVESLLDLASVPVAEMMDDKEEVDRFNIPKHLKENVLEGFKDWAWRRIIGTDMC